MFCAVVSGAACLAMERSKQLLLLSLLKRQQYHSENLLSFRLVKTMLCYVLLQSFKTKEFINTLILHVSTTQHLGTGISQ